MPARTLRLVAATVALAACGGSDPDAPDATPDAIALDAAPLDAAIGPLRCLGAPPTADAPATIAVAGTVLAIVDYQVSPVEGATVELHARAGGAVIATATTIADGSFATTAPTGGHALDAWFAVSAPGRVPTNAFPGDPLVGGESAFLLLADATEIARWYTDAGATYTAAARTVIASVKDCDNDSPSGVTLAIAPATRTTYYDPDGQRWDPALTDGSNGFALATDAAADLSLTASIGAAALPARALAPAAGALTLTVITPRTP